MKLFFSPASPYVRKVMVFAMRLGLADRIEKLTAAANPVNRDPNIVAVNALGKVPTLLTDEGQALFDSRVICEYLNALGKGQLYPADGPGKWAVLAEHALYDGMLDASLLARYEEAMRPEALRWPAWRDGQMDKILVGLKHTEARVASFGDRFDLATITLGCLLGYLDFRFASFDWRTGHPKLAAWFVRFSALPEMKATVPTA